jgi:hypothetical protein
MIELAAQYAKEPPLQSVENKIIPRRPEKMGRQSEWPSAFSTR